MIRKMMQKRTQIDSERLLSGPLCWVQIKIMQFIHSPARGALITPMSDCMVGKESSLAKYHYKKIGKFRGNCVSRVLPFKYYNIMNFWCANQLTEKLSFSSILFKPRFVFLMIATLLFRRLLTKSGSVQWQCHSILMVFTLSLVNPFVKKSNKNVHIYSQLQPTLASQCSFVLVSDVRCD